MPRTTHVTFALMLGVFLVHAAGAADRGDSTATKHVYKTVGQESLALHVWNPPGHDADAAVPAIVFFHGGAFKMGDYHQFESQAAYFASRGMVAASVNYRLTSKPGVTVKDCIQDAKSAMRWVRSNAKKLGIDPERIAAGGGSAGGYLAMATLMLEDFNATTDPAGVSSKPDALVLFNPAFGSRKSADGKNDPRDPEGKGNLIDYVKPNQPPCINFFGTEDPFLPPAQAFVKAYRAAGNRCELVTYEGQTHSFFNRGEYVRLTLAEADTFLVSLGWLAKQPERR